MIKMLTLPVAIRFSDPDFLKDSNNLAIPIATFCFLLLVPTNGAW